MASIEKIWEAFQANKVCFLATVENGEPKVRPVSPMALSEGKLWFCTFRSRNIYRQLTIHPGLQMFSLGQDTSSVRITAKAVFEDNRAVKQIGLDTRPNLPRLFGRADNPEFIAYYLAEAKAELRSAPNLPPEIFEF